MSEIKRYNAEHFGDFEMVENTQGEWVRWEDVEKLIERLKTLEHDEEIRRMYTTVMGRPL